MFLKNQSKSETEIVGEIIQALEYQKIGFFWRQNNVGVFDQASGSYRKNKYAVKGVSDILGIYKGKLVAIEVKSKTQFIWVTSFENSLRSRPNWKSYSPDNKHKEHAFNQVLFHDNIRVNGGVAFFTFGFEHCLNKLKEHS